VFVFNCNRRVTKCLDDDDDDDDVDSLIPEFGAVRVLVGGDFH